MPVRDELGKEIIEKGDSYEKLFPDALKTYAEKFPSPPRYYEMCDEVKTVLDPVLRGSKKAADVFPALDEKLEKILKDAWKQVK